MYTEILTLSKCCNEELTKDFKCGHCKQDCESYETDSELN